MVCSKEKALAKAKRRCEKQIEKAEELTPSFVPDIVRIGAWEEHVDAAQFESYKRQLTEQYIPLWTQRALDFNDALDAMGQEDYDKLKRDSTALLIEIAQVDRLAWSSMAGDKPYIGRSHAFTAERLAYSCRARCHEGVYDHEKAIKDFTSCERLLKAEIAKETGKSRTKLYTLRAEIVDCRAMAYNSIKDREKAAVDYEAAHALVRLAGDDYDWDLDYGLDLPEIINNSLLQTYADQKRGKNRPHYTLKERFDIERKLSIHNYAKDRGPCPECGITRDSWAEVDMMHCGECDDTWFCPSELKKDVYKRHKKECPRSRRPIIFSDALRQEKIDSEMEWRGFCVYEGYGSHPYVIMQDPSTSRLFDSLTDRDVFFFPSEVELIPEKWRDEVVHCKEYEEYEELIVD